MSVKQTAQQYLDSGLSVLPAVKAEKRPAVRSWKEYQKKLPTAAELRAWDWSDGLCLICGAVSGNLELIDFDNGGELYEAWASQIPSELIGRLAVERSQSGGYHVVYRCEEEVCGNVKLASGWRNGKLQALIETRGEGGLFLCHPTPGYEMIAGDLAAVSTITAAERDTLLSTAYSLNEIIPQPKPVKSLGRGVDVRPGDDFNDRGDVRWILDKHGWSLWRPGENEYWCRPGKSGSCSATLKEKVFYCFTSNAHPFQPGEAYSPFSVYAMLEHSGDYAAAATALRREGYGEQQFAMTDDDEPVDPGPPDPGPFPAELLDVPGFLGEVMAWNLAGAYVPQPVLALAGALSLLSVLTGQKVKDEFGTRTNLYCLGVARSGFGKERARQVNKEILYRAGLERFIGGEGVASHAGFVNAVNVQPVLLFQLDEIGRLLTTAGDARKAPHLYNIITVLMKLFTSASSIYKGDVYADAKKNLTIDQPHAVVYGTTVPDSLLNSFTAESVTDGFVSRLLIFEGDDNAARITSLPAEPPESIIETARFWGSLQPGGNLQSQHPQQIVVPASGDAATLLTDFEQWSHRKTMSDGDSKIGSLWTRATEKARKLALLSACSRQHESPQINHADSQWALAVSRYLVERTIYLAKLWVAETDYERRRKRLCREIEAAGPSGVRRSELTRLLQRLPRKERDDLFQDVTSTRDIVTQEVETEGRAATVYVSRRFVKEA